MFEEGPMRAFQRHARPFALCAPSRIVSLWAPEVENWYSPKVSYHGREFVDGTATAVREMKLRTFFAEHVKIPQQAAAEAAPFTRADEWFLEVPAGAGTLDALAPLPQQVPVSTALDRADGATIHITIEPAFIESDWDALDGAFDSETGEEIPWGHSAPDIFWSDSDARSGPYTRPPIVVDITAAIRVPGRVEPVGSIHATAVQRGERFFRDGFRLFSVCDDISAELINGVAEYVSADTQQIHPHLKAAPLNIPTSCDRGPIAVLHKVQIEQDYRGSGLGMDALVGFL